MADNGHHDDKGDDHPVDALPDKAQVNKEIESLGLDPEKYEDLEKEF